jgi:hypothetical protein
MDRIYEPQMMAVLGAGAGAEKGGKEQWWSGLSLALLTFFAPAAAPEKADKCSDLCCHGN